MELGGVPVPKPVVCHVARTAEGETRFGGLSETPYGTPLAWLPAGKLASLDDPSIRDCWRNRAIWAALKELPEDWPVVLYWH